MRCLAACRPTGNTLTASCLPTATLLCAASLFCNALLLSRCAHYRDGPATCRYRPVKYSSNVTTLFSYLAALNAALASVRKTVACATVVTYYYRILKPNIINASSLSYLNVA